jgi:hypothetical protein
MEASGRRFLGKTKGANEHAPFVFPLYIYCRKKAGNYVQTGQSFLVFKINDLENSF